MAKGKSGSQGPKVATAVVVTDDRVRTEATFPVVVDGPEVAIEWRDDATPSVATKVAGHWEADGESLVRKDGSGGVVARADVAGHGFSPRPGMRDAMDSMDAWLMSEGWTLL